MEHDLNIRVPDTHMRDPDGADVDVTCGHLWKKPAQRISLALSMSL